MIRSEEKGPGAFQQKNHKNGHIGHGFQNREEIDLAFQLDGYRADGENREAEREPIMERTAAKRGTVGGDALHDAHNKGDDPHLFGEGLPFFGGIQLFDGFVRQLQRVQFPLAGKVDDARDDGEHTQQRVKSAAEDQG